MVPDERKQIIRKHIMNAIKAPSAASSAGRLYLNVLTDIFVDVRCLQERLPSESCASRDDDVIEFGRETGGGWGGVLTAGDDSSGGVWVYCRLEGVGTNATSNRPPCIVGTPYWTLGGLSTV